MTETETAADTTRTGDVVPTALEAAVTTTDHLRIGRAWIASGVLFLVASLVAGLLVSLERMDLSGMALFGSVDTLFRLWSAYRVGIVLLAVVPIIVGLATAVVPLQVGASSVVFPRAASLGFWVWAMGAAITVTGFLIDGGLGTPGGTSRTDAVALTLLGLLMVIGGICCSTVCILTTIVAGRTGGMTLSRIPLFAWTVLVAGSIWLVTLPVLAANAVLIYVDLSGRSAVAFGVEDTIWEQLSWAFSHPQVYAFALPLVGIAGDIVPVAARRRHGSHSTLLVLTALIGLLSFGAYAQSAFDIGTPIREQAIFVVEAFLIVPVVLAVLAGLVDTWRRGSGGRPPAPLVLSMLAVLLLLDGAIVGAIRAVSPLDLLETSATGAQMTFTIGGVLVAVMAGTLWWGDRILGRVAPQGLGFVSGLSAAAGVTLIGVADTISGLLGMNDFTAGDAIGAGSPGSVVDIFNVVAVVGAALLLVGVMGWGLTGLRRLRGAEAPADPWGGHTLEWATGPVEVTSDSPLLDVIAEVGS
ncbi:MAG: cbb3-type cytochrome c oxidase subunit I [Acidimicrobiia bacterium]|nr:cbb3-type cytochrome c oxidase subunit I [Actinomycetota bacterium]MBL6925059.1 cbb3-type cytochrome c oxidase subunit I [Acidimicrobiia bacterium]MBL6927255.1 cbb3-type cytochrome c oxidase subunit I [Acidimicrobiia bacterium]